MWEMKGDNIIVNEKHRMKLFATAAIILQEPYEERVDELFDTVDEAKAALAKQFAQLKAEDDKRPWEIDDDGNACNERDGEKIFVSVSVERGCGGHRKNLGDFKSTNEARDFIKKLVTKLNAEATA